MHDHQLIIQDTGFIRRITIAREAKLNALNQAVLSELEAAVADALATDAIRGILLTGAGDKAFVAGADIGEFSDFDPEQGRMLARSGQATFDLIERSSKPVVVAINGYALGGGLELALAGHIRVAVKHARLGLPEVSLGIIPGYGGTQRLTRLVGRGRALEMILTGDMFTAAEALEYGLLNHVVEATELFAKAEEILDRITVRSPNAVAAAIRAVNASFGDTAAGFETEINEFGKCFGTPDFKTGVRAFLEKRKPDF